MRIYKYDLEPDRRQMVMMPEGSIPLSVLQQDGRLVMYAQVDPETALTPRIFVVVTTGDHFEGEGKTFIGSCLLGNPEWFVAHVFEQQDGITDPIDARNEGDFAQVKTELVSSWFLTH